MITGIHGTLEASRVDSAILRVGGFSIRVFAPTSTLSRLGETGAEVSLFTHFHMREDGIALYGFSTEGDRDAFERLIDVSGVGATAASPAGRIQAEVMEALIGLGFSNAEAQAAIARIPQDQAMTLEQQVTYALRSFSQK